MISKDGPQAHGAGVEDGLVAQTAETGMAVDYLYVLPDDDVPEGREEGEDGGEGGLAVDDEEGDVIDLESVGQIAYTGSALVGVCDDDDFVAAVYELLCGV